MQKGKRKKKQKKIKITYSSIIIFACIGLIVVEFFCSVFNKTVEIERKKAEIARLEQKYEATVNEKHRLESIMDSSNLSQYQTEKAREYGYCYPEEKIFYAFY